jgi:hypothetical protein
MSVKVSLKKRKLADCLCQYELFAVLGADAGKDKNDEKKSEISKEGNKSAAEYEAKSLVDTVREKAAEA